MASKFLKKIIAKDQQGLNTISAICSESKIKISDIKFLKNNQIFLLLIERFNKEGSKKEKKINSILKFDYINASKSKNINQKKKELSQKYKVKIEYLELRNKMNLVKSNNINNSNLFFAYYLNNIRLIDNV